VRSALFSTNYGGSGEVGRSKLFNQDPSLRALRDRIKREDVPMNRFEADVRRLKAPRHGDQETTSTGSIYRAELIYSSDLDTVLSLLKRQA